MQWTQASDQLNSIPPSTNAYGQAQELLKSYQAKITTAQEKVLEEDNLATIGQVQAYFQTHQQRRKNLQVNTSRQVSNKPFD